MVVCIYAHVVKCQSPPNSKQDRGCKHQKLVRVKKDTPKSLVYHHVHQEVGNKMGVHTMFPMHTVDGCEILHQLADGFSIP